MSKQDFIDRLRAALNGKVSPGQVIENVNYYEEYINTQIRMGRTDEEVLADLGDPRLIAKSIVTANGDSGYEAAAGYSRESDFNGDADRRGRWNSFSNSNMHQEEQHSSGRGLPKWFRPVVWLIVVIGVFAAFFSILSFLAPIVIPILVVMFFVKLFRDWLN